MSAVEMDDAQCEVPEKVIPPFVWFARKARQDLLDQNPDQSHEDRETKLKEMWEELSAENQKQWNDMTTNDTERYKSEMADYSKSNRNGGSNKKRRIENVASPKTAYLLFASEVQPKLETEHPGCEDMSEKVSEAWKALSDEEKQNYKDRHEASKPESQRAAVVGGVGKTDGPFTRDFFFGTTEREYETISLAAFLLFAEEVRANLGTHSKSTDTKVHTTISEAWVKLPYDKRVEYATHAIDQPEEVNDTTANTTTTTTQNNSSNNSNDGGGDHRTPTASPKTVKEEASTTETAIDNWHEAKAQSKMANYAWTVEGKKFNIDFSGGNLDFDKFVIEVNSKNLRKVLKACGTTGKGTMFAVTFSSDGDGVKKFSTPEKSEDQEVKGLEFALPATDDGFTESVHFIMQKEQVTKGLRLQITHTSKPATGEPTLTMLYGTTTSTE